MRICGNGQLDQAKLSAGVLSEQVEELMALLEHYQQELVPLIVPFTLLKHHRNRYPVPGWVDQQVYLHPYPKELMLRNHV